MSATFNTFDGYLFHEKNLKHVVRHYSKTKIFSLLPDFGLQFQQPDCNYFIDNGPDRKLDGFRNVFSNFTSTDWVHNVTG